LGSHTPSPGAGTAYEDGQDCPVQGRRECETLYAMMTECPGHRARFEEGDAIERDIPRRH